MRHLAGFAFAAAALTAPVLAADQPAIAPAADWVKPVAIPAPDPKLADKPLQSLLLTSQTRFDPKGDEVYVEWATLIQDPQGLAGMGNISIPWQPEFADLIVHKVHVLREGKVIDILGNGQTFTVLRRENNLEMAMLDGVLTAVIQPEGLAVGDTLDVAFSLRLKKGSIPFRSESFLALPTGMVTRHVLYRLNWPTSKTLRWKADPAFGRLAARKTGEGTELVVDLKDIEPPQPPADSPPRYRMPPILHLSEYRDWSEVSALLAPAYEEASRLPDASPLRPEIERIATATTDPKARALAALRLIQDKIRYVFLGMNEGGYIPASAEQTWARKFGDCKGKTVALIAVLRELGIEAEPVLVSSTIGDALDASLPQVRIFDHVIVRARIDGRSYWLDGTRTGDRDLEALASAPFRGGLPVRAAGAALEAIPLAPPPWPLTETVVTYDASTGFERPVPVSGEIIFRGDLATMMRMTHAQVGKQEFARKMEGFGAVPDGDELTSIDFVSDDAAGTFTARFAGRSSMDWETVPSSLAVRYRFDDETIAWDAKFKRDKGVFENAPFALAFPVSIAEREIVLLPNKGQGFTIDGKNLDRTVAGTHITRTLSLQDGKAIAYSTFRRLQPELGAAEALASADAIEEINADEAFVRTPSDYKLSDAEIQAILSEQPKDAEGFVTRGYRHLNRGEYAKAIADFDKAIALSPKWARPVSNKAVALIHQRKLDAAEVALAAAKALDDKDFVVHQGYGMLYVERDRPTEAVEAFTRSLLLFPENDFTLTARAIAHQRLGHLEQALKDLESALALDPDNDRALVDVARIHAALGHQEQALATMDRLVRLEPDNGVRRFERGELLDRFGRREEAASAYAEALQLIDKEIAKAPASVDYRDLRADILARNGQVERALEELNLLLAKSPDNVRLLNNRCWMRATANRELEKALADCDKALEYDPENLPATDSRGLVKLRLGRLEEAIADLDNAVKWFPKHAPSLYVRGIARRRMGDIDGGDKDLSAARSLVFDIDAEYKGYGVIP